MFKAISDLEKCGNLGENLEKSLQPLLIGIYAEKLKRKKYRIKVKFEQGLEDNWHFFFWKRASTMPCQCALRLVIARRN